MGGAHRVVKPFKALQELGSDPVREAAVKVCGGSMALAGWAGKTAARGVSTGKNTVQRRYTSA